ncbi:MAG: sigma-70 family RNA polymerase sigma factor [Clostridia bacterium]|nr:sigma-70 family RNA polymerase sigma factor [Clostridia bacterium]
MQDKEIIGLFFERNEEAIKQTDVKYGCSLLGIAKKILCSRQDAEECVNDAYLSVWNKIPPEEPKSLFAYVSKIVRNTALTRLRDGTAKKRKTGVTVCLDELAEVLPAEDDVSEQIVAAELSALINGFLINCEEDDRNIFILRYYGFKSVSDIAKQYGCTQSRVKMSLKRTRDRLSEHLERNGYKV